MLISHTHHFVFVKPRKTAGTSVELALSQHLGFGDLATPIEPDEELIRRNVPGVMVGLVRGRVGVLPARLRDHSPLKLAMAMLPQIVDYRIVTMCRNPWDRAVSQFFWSMRRGPIRAAPSAEQHAAFRAFTHRWGPRTWLDNLYGRKRERALDQTPLYTIAGCIKANYVIRFEALEADVVGLEVFLGLDGTPSVAGITAKSGLRAGGGAWIPFYDAATRDLVAHECAEEIALFGYDFEGGMAPRGPLVDHFGGPPDRSASVSQSSSARNS